MIDERLKKIKKLYKFEFFIENQSLKKLTLSIQFPRSLLVFYHILSIIKNLTNIKNQYHIIMFKQKVELV